MIFFQRYIFFSCNFLFIWLFNLKVETVLKFFRQESRLAPACFAPKYHVFHQSCHTFKKREVCFESSFQRSPTHITSTTLILRFPGAINLSELQIKVLETIIFLQFTLFGKQNALV